MAKSRHQLQSESNGLDVRASRGALGLRNHPLRFTFRTSGVDAVGDLGPTHSARQADWADGAALVKLFAPDRLAGNSMKLLR